MKSLTNNLSEDISSIYSIMQSLDDMANALMSEINTNSTSPLCTGDSVSTMTFDASAINDLSDVVITTPSTNQILKYNGTNWVNGSDTDTGILYTDLSVTTAAAGSPALSYNNTNGVFTYTPPDLTSYITASSTDTFTNKSGNISQWTNDAGYLTSETDSQTLSLSGTTLSISTGNNVDLGVLTLDDFADVQISGVADGQFLTYNNGSVLMAGFRDYTLDKYINRLTEYGYTIPVYIQEKEGKVVTRILDKVYSPGTLISCETDASPIMTNNISKLHCQNFNAKVNNSSILILLFVCIYISLIYFMGLSQIFFLLWIFCSLTSNFSSL